MRGRLVDIEIGTLAIDDPALARADVAASLERELGQLLRVRGLPGDRGPASLGTDEPQEPIPAIAREIYGRLMR